MRHFRYHIRIFSGKDYHDDVRIFSADKPKDFIYKYAKEMYNRWKRLGTVEVFTYEITVHEITLQAFEDKEEYSEPLKEYHFYA